MEKKICFVRLQQDILDCPCLLQSSGCADVNFFAATLTLYSAALSVLTQMHLVTPEGFLSKPLIVIKQIDQHVALVIIFKWMQEGLGKDIEKCQLTAGYRRWVMTYALLNKSVSDTVKSILLHVVHQAIIIKNLISKL